MAGFEVAEADDLLADSDTVMQIRITSAVNQILQEITKVSSAASKVDIYKLESTGSFIEALRKNGFDPDSIAIKFQETYDMAKEAKDYKSMLRVNETILKMLSDTKTANGKPINELKQINIQNNNAAPLSPEDMELMKVKKAREAKLREAKLKEAVQDAPDQ